MKPTRVQVRAWNAIQAYKAETKADTARLNKAIAMLQNDINNVKAGGCADSGIYGKVAEVLSHDERSTIKRVQKQNAVDLYIIIDGKRVKAEYKTNGGRIGKLIRMRNKSTTYIVYEGDFTSTSTYKKKDGTISKPEPRVIEPTIMTVETFLNILASVPKSTVIIGHNETDKEPAIKPSKKLYLALKEFNGTKYDRAKTYTSANIK